MDELNITVSNNSSTEDINPAPISLESLEAKPERSKCWRYQ